MGEGIADILSEIVERDCRNLEAKGKLARIPRVTLSDLEVRSGDRWVECDADSLDDIPPLHAGNVGRTYVARLKGGAGELLLKRPHEYVLRSLALRSGDERRAACEQMARVVRLASSADVRAVTGVVLPAMYAVSESAGLMTLMPRLDLNAAQFMGMVREEYDPERLERELRIPVDEAASMRDAIREAYAGRDGVRLAVRNVVLSMLRAAALYQEAGGNLHRDYKPGNLVMRLATVVEQARIAHPAAFIEAQERASLVNIVDWDLAYTEEVLAGGGTTFLPGFSGTEFYTPYRIHSNPTLENLRDPWRDVYALGVTTAVLGLGLRPRSQMREATSRAFKDEWLASEEPGQAAEALGYPGLDEIVTLCMRSEVRSVREVYDLSREVFAGKSIAGLPIVAQAMLDRFTPEPQMERERTRTQAREEVLHDVRREHLRGFLRGAARWGGVAASAALSIALAMLGDDYFTLKAYREDHARSPQEMARKVAENPEDPQAWERYDESWIRVLKEDDRELFRTPEARKLPPVSAGFFPGVSYMTEDRNGLLRVSGTDFDASGSIAQFLAAYHLSRDPSLLEPLSHYLDANQLSLSSRWGDYTNAAIGRFEILLYHEDLLSEMRAELAGRRDAGARQAIAAIDGALARSRYAAFVGAHQFLRYWSHEHGDINVLDEYFLTPLVAVAAARPSVLELPEPHEERFAGEREVWEEVTGRYGSIDATELQRKVIMSGNQMCEALVLSDGRSFGKASWDGGWRRDLYSEEDPARGMPGEKVVMVDHAGLSVVQAYRMMLARSLEGSALLADPEIAAAVTGNAECADRLESFMRAKTRDRSIVPSEFYPTSAGHPALREDGHAHARDLWKLAVEGRYDEVRRGMLVSFASSPMRTESLPPLWFDGLAGVLSFPEPYNLNGAPVKGWDFPSSRWLIAGYRGPNNLGWGTRLRAYMELRRNEK